MSRAAPASQVINHWAVLGLEPGADATSLKRAFRQQARATVTSTIRELFPSLKDTEKPEPPADWMP